MVSPLKWNIGGESLIRVWRKDSDGKNQWAKCDDSSVPGRLEPGRQGNIFAKNLDSGGKELLGSLGSKLSSYLSTPQSLHLWNESNNLFLRLLWGWDEIRHEAFRKALAHRDSRHELLFTGIHLFMSRISWLILHRTPVCGAVGTDHLIWGGAVSLFFRFWFISENRGPERLCEFCSWSSTTESRRQRSRDIFSPCFPLIFIVSPLGILWTGAGRGSERPSWRQHSRDIFSPCFPLIFMVSPLGILWMGQEESERPSCLLLCTPFLLCSLYILSLSPSFILKSHECEWGTSLGS